MKKCPYCFEEVQDEAIKCKHCGELLDAKLRSQEKKAANKPKEGAFLQSCNVGCAIILIIIVVIIVILSNPHL